MNFAGNGVGKPISGQSIPIRGQTQGFSAIVITSSSTGSSSSKPLPSKVKIMDGAGFYDFLCFFVFVF